MDVVVGIAVAVVDPGVVVEMVVAAEVHPHAGSLEAAPERITLGRVVVETVRMQHAERRLVAEDKDVRLGLGLQLGIEPCLIHPMGKSVIRPPVLVQPR